MFTLLEQTGHIPSGDNKVHSSDAISSNPAGCFNNGKCAWTVLYICMYGYVFVCVLVFMCVPVCQCVGISVCIYANLILVCTYLEKSGHIPSGGSKVHIPSGGSKVHIASGGRKGHIPSGGSKAHGTHYS